MTLITQHENPAEFAPTISYNHCGQMPWSGRHASAFSGKELIELLSFCEHEGRRQGLNDAIHQRIGAREEAPFHEEFLDGYPKKLWESCYWDGVHESAPSTLEAIELEIQQALALPETSDWLRLSLTTALQRDCVDAVNDAESLCDILTRRYNALCDKGANG